MHVFRLCLVWLALLVVPAFAQPGADLPPPPSPVPPPDQLPIVEGSVDVRANANVDLDAAIQKLATNAPLIERLAKGTFRRARRAVSIGPTIGAFGGVFPDADQSDFAITFGVGVEVFKVPVLPTMENIKAIAIDRAKARLKQGTAALDMDAFAREVWDDVVEEFVGMEGVRGKRLEKPRFTVGLEVNRLLDSEVWMTRFRAGLGISKITLAGTSAVAFTDPKTSVFAGFELVLHLMMSKGPRSSVADIFVRADFEVRNEGSSDFYGAGVRYLLDIL